MQRDVVEEIDLQADGDGLAEFRGDHSVVEPGTEVGERGVARAREFDPGAYDGGVEVQDGAQLNLDAELRIRRGERPALEHPPAAVAEGRCEVGEQAVALFVREGLNVERFHGVFIGEIAVPRDWQAGTRVT